MSDRPTTALSPAEESVAPADANADASPDANAPAPTPAPRRRGTALRAALRWTAAVVVFGALGSTVAYAVTDLDRTDVPTLATESDGRWTYPRLAKPPLPAGAPAPFAPANTGQIHYADLERLLLPAPEGSSPDPSLAGKDSRVPVSRFLQEYGESVRPTMAADLGDNGLRHIAARGWTMPDDGTSTRVYLLRFHSMATAQNFFGTHLQGATDASQKVTDVEKLSSGDKTFPYGGAAGTESYVYDEVAPRGPVHVRHAYISAGDTLALIVQSRKGSAPRVPFHQTVILQNQLLG
ncbi:hypothetical protein ACFUN8_03475 [Streptomyces sp. NPDC057307]|uniref:hypothetical protein n=1 Tax=Streptomyces sp. NPDC057307 TaxID=3346096 RepID=UPI00362EE229